MASTHLMSLDLPLPSVSVHKKVDLTPLNPTKPNNNKFYGQNLEFGGKVYVDFFPGAASLSSSSPTTSGDYSIEDSLLKSERQDKRWGCGLKQSHLLMRQRIYNLRHVIAVLILILVFIISLCATILATEIAEDLIEDPVPNSKKPPRPSIDWTLIQHKFRSSNETNKFVILGRHPEAIAAKIQSLSDLQNIPKDCDTISVIQLKEEFDPQQANLTSPDDQVGTRVKNLEIMGPVTGEWLRYLLKKFRNVSNLTIDAHQLCQVEFKGEREFLNIVQLDNVKSLQVFNSQLCHMSSWVLTWEMPHIEHFGVFDSYLRKDVYDPIHDFLYKNKGTLTYVTISRSYLCDDCAYTDIPFVTLNQFVISEQIPEPPEVVLMA